LLTIRSREQFGRGIAAECGRRSGIVGLGAGMTLADRGKAPGWRSVVAGGSALLDSD